MVITSKTIEQPNWKRSEKQVQKSNEKGKKRKEKKRTNHKKRWISNWTHRQSYSPRNIRQTQAQNNLKKHTISTRQSIHKHPIYLSSSSLLNLHQLTLTLSSSTTFPTTTTSSFLPPFPPTPDEHVQSQHGVLFFPFFLFVARSLPSQKHSSQRTSNNCSTLPFFTFNIISKWI